MSGLDIAPLLVLRIKPLHSFYQSLLASPSSRARPATRMAPLRFTIHPSTTLKSAPLAVVKPLVATSPPSCALTLEDQPSPLPLQVSHQKRGGGDKAVLPPTSAYCRS